MAMEIRHGHKEPVLLPEDRTIIYNGVETRWFIGDINISRALRLGCVTQEDGNRFITNHDGAFWEAWGSCNGRVYQLSAWYSAKTRELVDIEVLPRKQKKVNLDGTTVEEDAYYFHEETYRLLTN